MYCVRRSDLIQWFSDVWVLDIAIAGWSERSRGESDSEAPMQCVWLYTGHGGDTLNPHLSGIPVYSSVTLRIVFAERR